jgi:hypothetical protein
MRPPISIFAFRRLADTRRRIDAVIGKARAEVIRAQLVAMRGTYAA